MTSFGINSPVTSRALNNAFAELEAMIFGAVPADSLTGTTLAANVVNSSLTSVGTLVSGSIPATLLTGTINTARLSGSYTGITGLGTLTTSLTVDTASSPSVILGDWTAGTAYSGVTGTQGYLLVSHASDTGVYLRATGASALVNLGGNGSSTLRVGNSATTLIGSLTESLGSLSNTGGTELNAWSVTSTTSNADSVDYRLIRRTTGSDWTTAYHRIQRLVDVTRMGFVQFGSHTGSNAGVEIGYSNTTYLAVNGTTGLVTVDLPIVSSQSFSATNSGNQTNYVKLGTGATDSNATLFGFTAYGNLRTTCGYNVGISWISTGAGSPSGFVPNAHAVFLAGTTHSGDIRSNANNATSYNTSSDYRLKRDVVDIDDGIELIRQLRPKRFKFIDDPTDTVFDGFLAHEVQDIVPVAVSGAKDAIGENGHPMYQQIDTSWMVALLTAGIKDLDERLRALETT